MSHRGKRSESFRGLIGLGVKDLKGSERFMSQIRWGIFVLESQRCKGQRRSGVRVVQEPYRFRGQKCSLVKDVQGTATFGSQRGSVVRTAEGQRGSGVGEV